MSFGQESLSLKAHKPWITEAPWILEHCTRMENESLTFLTSTDCLVLLKSPTQASSSTGLCLPCVFRMLSMPPLYNVVSCLISLLSQSPLLDPFQPSFYVTLSEALNGDDSRPITRLLKVLSWLHLKSNTVCSPMYPSAVVQALIHCSEVTHLLLSPAPDSLQGDRDLDLFGVLFLTASLSNTWAWNGSCTNLSSHLSSRLLILRTWDLISRRVDIISTAEVRMVLNLYAWVLNRWHFPWGNVQISFFKMLKIKCVNISRHCYESRWTLCHSLFYSDNISYPPSICQAIY